VSTKQSITFKDTGYFSKIICDYLEEKEGLQKFYNHFPNINGFKKQIEIRLRKNDLLDRKILVQTLLKQYKKIPTSAKSKNNIESLLKENTFTITTGHQLNLFTGPLYFLYKIISTINLTIQLKKEFPENNFVPVYWMATEDHDFEEIQYFNFQGKKIKWKREAAGAVGRLSTEGLKAVLNDFSQKLGTSTNGVAIRSLFKRSYLEHNNLADATRFLANELFGAYGLVIMDADNKDLKKRFIPFIKEELLQQTSHIEVSDTIEKLGQDYKIQVNPREINLFYLNDNLRERIIFEEDVYIVNNTNLTFTKESLMKEVEESPEKFSPNVLLRPLYQEVILPNLCYIGGGGELAYWFELKKYFDVVDVPFPILLLRNSAVLCTTKQGKKMKRLNISKEDIFAKQNELINRKIKNISDISIDFTEQRSQLKKMFFDLEILSNKTDSSFLGAVKAQEKKQINGINKLEKRLLKAQKRKLKEVVDRITTLQDQIFPHDSLQERNANFSEFYLNYGESLIPILFNALQPLELKFDLIEI
jgi:bacillithiol biosynthesis cysteine-adding enzyme BshC